MVGVDPEFWIKKPVVDPNMVDPRADPGDPGPGTIARTGTALKLERKKNGTPRSCACFV